jgi:hypothetical protein
VQVIGDGLLELAELVGREIQRGHDRCPWSCGRPSARGDKPST